jgi:hypothetical protein
MSDPALLDDELRHRLTAVADRHVDPAPSPDGAARARRTARRRAAWRAGTVAAAAAVVVVGVPVLVLGPGSVDRGAVTPIVTAPPEPTVAPPEPDPAPDDGGPSPAPTPSPSPSPDATGTAPTSALPDGAPTGDELPGTPAGSHVPEAGAVLPVIGVSGDDVLNVRDLPGPDGRVVAGIAPTGEATATGRARDVESGRWVEVTVDGVTGWVSGRFVALGAGATEDVTAVVLDRHGGSVEASSMPELARLVALALTPVDTEPRVTVAAGPVPGDPAEITVDVLGLADDAVLGYRLRVFAVDDGGASVLRTVEATSLCGRGVTADGLCV